MINTDALTKVFVPPPSIKPVGITPATTVGGKVVTQTQGSGYGLFGNLFNTGLQLYSTFKTATAGATSVPAAMAGQTSNNIAADYSQQSQPAQPGTSPLLVAGVIFVTAKILKLI